MVGRCAEEMEIPFDDAELDEDRVVVLLVVLDVLVRVAMRILLLRWYCSDSQIPDEATCSLSTPINRGCVCNALRLKSCS